MAERYKVTTVITRTETITEHVWAVSPDHAERLSEEHIAEGAEGDQETVSWDITTEVVDRYGPHEAEPVHLREHVDTCKVCDRRVRWTGMNYDDPANTTGATIPGPWVHVEAQLTG